MNLATISKLIITFSLSLLQLISKSTSTYLDHICSNATEFATNSDYHTNLNTLFKSLSSNAAINLTGFDITSAGTNTSDVVYGLFLCHGDQNITGCSDCVETATTTDLPKTFCPNRKVAVIWYDECMVRYSNESLLGKMEPLPKVSIKNPQSMTGDQTAFSDLLGNTMNSLAAQTANSKTSGKQYATKVTTIDSLKTLYAMEQCTPDISASDCFRCLTIAIGSLDVMMGARVLQPSCFVRYEIYPFYNGASNVSSPPLPSPSPSPGKKKTYVTKVVVAIVIPIVVLTLLIASCTYYVCWKAKKSLSIDIQNVLEDFTTAESLIYEFSTLQAATNYFSDDLMLGGGGFGNVYKGTLPNGQVIAVKRLSRVSNQGIESFKNEAVLIAKLQHKNLVRLLGFCLTREEKLLVYEYVPNKSLNYFLFDPKKQGELDWPMRYNIITGIARGLLYLHEDSRPRIVHRDLKAANILLEKDMNPKIADFGLARIFKAEQTEDDTNIIAGTYGYMAPEYAMHGQFSVKSDVYSFGVLVLEIVSGKKINSKFNPSGVGDLLTHAWRSLKEETPLNFMDPTLKDTYSADEVMRSIHLGSLCVQENAHERPTMSTVVFMLINTNSTTSILSTPQRPRFYYNSSVESSHIMTRSNKNSTATSSTSCDSMPYTQNQVTISEMNPR